MTHKNSVRFRDTLDLSQFGIDMNGCEVLYDSSSTLGEFNAWVEEGLAQPRDRVVIVRIVSRTLISRFSAIVNNHQLEPGQTIDKEFVEREIAHALIQLMSVKHARMCQAYVQSILRDAGVKTPGMFMGTEDVVRR